MKKRKVSSKLLTGLFLVSFLFLGIAGCVSGQKAKESPALQGEIPTVLVANAVKKTVPIYGEYVGTVDASTGSATVEVRARVPAFLMTQCFEEGKFVKKGQLLFILDRRTYEANLESAKAKLAQAVSNLAYARQEVAVQRAKADLVSAEAQLSLAKITEARLKPLMEQKAIPRQDYDNAAANLQVAKADVIAKKAMYRNTVLDQVNSVAQAKASVKDCRANVENCKINLGYCTVTSPIDGVAGRRLVAPGNLVGQGEATLLTTITNLNHLRVNFNISEEDYLIILKRIAKKKNRYEAFPVLELILADGNRYPEKGRIVIAQPALDPKTGTLLVIGEFPNPDYLLRPGMFGRIRLALNYKENAILIPQKAVSELQSDKIAYVVGPDNKVELRTLQLGDKTDHLVVVNKGIKAGEKIIVEGQLKIHPGMQVKPVYKPASKE
ncbi:MAG: efflux RND transporter periplasmic adaptor subunit [Firmicutes bacterium]|nr:efflux RND transporter periplasmic adaptor subunit [Bacillota bacterium]